MKQLIVLFLLTLTFTSCYDNFRIGGLEEVPTEAIDAESVLFVDSVMDENGPLSDAVVSVYADNVRYSDLTDSDGRYSIEVPADKFPTTGYISLSITKEAYQPHNETYKTPLVAGSTYDSGTSGILMAPCPDCLTVDEKSSELIHLGDDRYQGTINSQFQKATDGTEYEFQLEGSAGYGALKLSFEAKGLQPDRFDMRSSVQFISGAEVVTETELDVNAPEDGSFGLYELEVTNASPITALKLITRNHGTAGSDYDDWEFTCLYVQGIK